MTGGAIIRVPFTGRSWSSGVWEEEYLVFIILIWRSGLYRSRISWRSILLFPACICLSPIGFCFCAGKFLGWRY